MTPLEGLKVVDFTTWIMGPVCAATLGDWGAEVVKIEAPETGDPFRWYLMAAGIDESEVPVSLYQMDNRNKRGIAIDLKQKEGQEIVHKMIEEADIFVSNIPTDSLKNLNLDYARLSAINPGLIYAHASGFGDEGPDAAKPGFDATAYWARSGLMGGLALEDQPPVYQQYAGIGDQVSGLVLFGGVLLAILNRQKTGLGQQVDLSLLGVGTWVTACALQYTLSFGEEPARRTRTTVRNPLLNYYKTRDDKWVMIICLPDEPYWTPLCRCIGREDLETDPKFGTRDARLENNEELIAIFDSVFQKRTRTEWAASFDEHGIVWTHIPTSFEEVTKDPQVLANKHITDVDHPELGTAKTLTTPIRLNKEAPPIKSLGPEIGQHTEEVLLELGYSWEDIGDLMEKGVIP
ncbi:MAG: CoA transferase [Proteobacteria bacterium]|nr:CoA transferase [Pseudomonadota bacterium]